MPIVSIRHRTSYRYRNPVAFGEHRMMLRPAEGFDQRLIAFDLAISPEPALLRQAHDLSDACVAVARFETRSDLLTVESRAELEHRIHDAFDLEADGAAIGARRFAYDEDEAAALIGSVGPRHEGAGEVEAWARRFVRPVGATRLSTLLGEMTHAIRADFTYRLRREGSPQTPLETLERRTGSCRDFAVLMMEAARSLGLAARFASGYVYGGSPKATAGPGHGHTHAWTRVYLPGAGWADFDPTNGIVGNAGLIRVAAAADPRLAVPLHGAWRGMRSDFLGMEVEVDIRADDPAAEQPTPLQRVAQTG
ncbi:MAG TPA: transglutaminase family protein [Caulobacteraceae bacterium]|jgi:transglutaminase-like putative cysteine protease|nr:transglutaminase family protein [Caulobacteraceae bacterium]